MKKARGARKMMRRKRTTLSSVVTGKSEIYLGTLTPNMNINNPANPNTTGKFDQFYGIRCSELPELNARATTYKSFRVKKVEMFFQRDTSRLNNAIASATFNGTQQDNVVIFPNPHQTNVPVPTATNGPACYTWSCNQAGAKKISLDTLKFKKSLKASILEQREYVTGNASYLPAATTRVCPWMDFQSDLGDSFRFGQWAIYQPPIDVQTTAALSTTAGTPGLSVENINEIYRWHQRIRITWQVRGRGPTAALAV